MPKQIRDCYGLGLIGLSLGAAIFGAMNAIRSSTESSQTLELSPIKLVHQFGRFGQNEVIEGEIGFVNQFTAPIQVIQVSQSCSCTSVVADSTEVGPAEQLSLRLSWRTGLHRGPLREVVRVLYRTPDGHLATSSVDLAAEVEPDIAYEPRQLTFDAGQPGQAVARFSPGRMTAFTLQSAEVNHTGFDARVGPDGRSVVVTLTDPRGLGLDPINLGLTVMCDSKAEPRMWLPIKIEAGK